jgi:hypothetical protein
VVPGRNDYDQIAIFDSTASDGLIIIDTIRLAGVIAYKTKTVCKNLSSLFSKETNVSLPGTGYQIFTAPAKNDTLKQGATFQIKWNPLNVSPSTINLTLSSESARVLVYTVYNANQTGSYSWSIPTSVAPGR